MRQRRPRVAAWGGATLLCASAAHWLSPAVASAVRSMKGAGPVDPGPAALVLLATAWLVGWGALTLVEVGRCLASAHPVEPRSRVARLLVEALVGSTLLTATGAVAEAPPDPPTSLAGLALPDRVAGEVVASTRAPAPTKVEVEAGDSLWALAERHLDRAGAAAVDQAWRLLYRANRREVGPDPDLIRPGTVLRMPASLTPCQTGARR